MSDSSDAAGKSALLYSMMYNSARNDLAPYRQAGEKTMPLYGGMLGIPGYDKVDPTQQLRSTPGYNWLMDQGTEAIERKAAANGMVGSGPVMKGLQTYGQGVADQTYQNYMNRLYQLITGGANASAQTGQFGMQAAQGISNAMTDAAKTDAMLEAQQQKNSLFSDILGGAGLLGGIALSAVPGGGWGKTVGGSLVNWLRGA